MKRLQFANGIKASYFFAFTLLIFVYTLTGIANAQNAKPWVAPAAANQLKNPLAGINNALKEAKTLYITNCAPCHGNNGKGDGIAAVALKPKPADHTSVAVQKETDGSLYWKITQGRSPMPTYKQVFSDNQRWELVNYIRTLAKHK